MYLTLNLLLPYVVLIVVSFESTNSFIMELHNKIYESTNSHTSGAATVWTAAHRLICHALNLTTQVRDRYVTTTTHLQNLHPTSVKDILNN